MLKISPYPEIMTAPYLAMQGLGYVSPLEAHTGRWSPTHPHGRPVNIGVWFLFGRPN